MPHKSDTSAASVLALSFAKPVGRGALVLLLLGLSFLQAEAQNAYSPYGGYSPYSRRGQVYASGYPAASSATPQSNDTSLTSYVSDYAGAPTSPQGNAVEQSATLSPPTPPSLAKPAAPAQTGMGTAPPMSGEAISPGYYTQPPANAPGQPAGVPYAAPGPGSYGAPAVYGGPAPGEPCGGGCCGGECYGGGGCCGGECYGGGDCYGGPTPIYSALCGLYAPLQNRLYGSADYLLWWTKGDHLPPLVTTADPGTALTATTAALGQPTTRILFGDDDVNNSARSGVRLTLGSWLDPCQQAGIEVTYLGFGANDQSTNFNSTTTPVLAIPFTNVATATQAALPIFYPGEFTGTFGIETVTRFDTLEALLRRNIYQNCGTGMDFLVGYRYARLTDTVTLDGTITAAPATIAAGTITGMDSFDTNNSFNGVEFGFNSQVRKMAWTLDMLMKLSLGDTRSQTTINGSESTNGVLAPHGFLALPSNIGVYTSNQFSIMPELGATVGYDFTSRLRGTVGYSFIYWSQVLRAGEQINTNINTAQTTATAANSQPKFPNATNDFWAQGLNVGLDYAF